MSKFDASMDIDANFKVVGGDFPFRAKKTITFAGATTHAWGNDGGDLDGGVMFTVTGMVKMYMFGECTETLVGGATLETGILNATAIFNAQTTDTNIEIGELWPNNATPATYFIFGESNAAADNFPVYILNGNDIILTVSGGQDTDSGVVDFIVPFRPLSDDGNIVDAGL